MASARAAQEKDKSFSALFVPFMGVLVAISQTRNQSYNIL
jgi:hypothetical protein